MAEGAMLQRLAALRYMIMVPPIIFLAEMLAHYSVPFFVIESEGITGMLLDATLIVVYSAPLLFLTVVRPMHTLLQQEKSRTVEREQKLMVEAERQHFESRLHRALERADTEEEALWIAKRAMDQVGDKAPVELLLADSSHAHLRRATAATAAENRCGCSVESPNRCAAVRQAQTLEFPDSEALDACPRLASRPDGPLGAVCVPVSIAGRAIGVLHAPYPVDGMPAREKVSQLEALATQMGARVGILRAMASKELAAHTDALTGLLNRRSLEDCLGALQKKKGSYSLVVCDLDHFKKLNDTFGHEAGDRALRLFGQVLKNTLRETDIICRYGGEEFVLVLPGVTVKEGKVALDRVRENLAGSLMRGSVPPFTASFGLVDSSLGCGYEELIQLADAALYDAKRAGRNRVSLGGGMAEAEPSLQLVTAQEEIAC